MKSLLTFFQPRYAYLAIYFNEEKLCKLLEKNLRDNVQLAKFQLGRERSWYCSNLGLGACCQRHRSKFKQ